MFTLSVWLSECDMMNIFYISDKYANVQLLAMTTQFNVSHSQSTVLKHLTCDLCEWASNRYDWPLDIEAVVICQLLATYCLLFVCYVARILVSVNCVCVCQFFAQALHVRNTQSEQVTYQDRWVSFDKEESGHFLLLRRPVVAQQITRQLDDKTQPLAGKTHTHIMKWWANCLILAYIVLYRLISSYIGLFRLRLYWLELETWLEFVCSGGKRTRTTQWAANR